MFDRSLLPSALFEFVVVADTHFMLELGQGREEFDSRAKQTARAETALRLAASLDTEFVVHLGDLVQEYPDTDAFPVAMEAAVEQLKQCGIDVHHVAGNHDVGDKPDPIMPTRPVSSKSLQFWHEKFGRSWYSFDRDDCHFIILNSQIMNTSLPEAEEQWRWLENDLEKQTGKRSFLFLHLPPYLWNTDERALGHYDNIADPARCRLIQLARKYQVDWMMSGHVHCAFFDSIGDDSKKPTRYLVSNSTSFTRPGFCHLFTSQPPADHGRDDFAKLGFHLFRVLADRVDAHWIRTSGEINIDQNNPSRRVIARTSASQKKSPLGVTLRHPLSNVTDIPLAWPSAIRQRVRNDYPLLACTELGTAWVRTPIEDFDDPFLAKRLRILRGEGIRIVATTIWSNDTDAVDLLNHHQNCFDELELQLVGTAWPSQEQLEVLQANGDKFMLSTIIPNEAVAGKQHLRTRHGFHVDELKELNQRLTQTDARINRVLCRLDGEPSLWENVLRLGQMKSLDRIDNIDLSLELLTTDDEIAVSQAAEALFAMLLLPGSRLFVDPLIDFDRTMDVCHGLLDPLCNPRPVFHTLRCLNSIMAAAGEARAQGESFTASEIEATTERIHILKTSNLTLCLILPTSGEANETDIAVSDAINNILSASQQWRAFHLADGTVTNGDGDNADVLLQNLTTTEPVLLWIEC